MKARRLFGCLVGFLLAGRAAAADTPFRANDVIALIGGEDMVALADSGRLEAQIVRQPGLGHVKVRSLAYEGDTVFEQHRQLNFPSWEEQLTKIGATVVIVQFGQMEALRTDVPADEFITQYEVLLKRLAGDNRQLIILSPTPFEPAPAPLPDRSSQNETIGAQLPRLLAVTARLDAAFIDLYRTFPEGGTFTRDGLHLNEQGQRAVALEITRQLGLKPAPVDDPVLLKLLAEKNRLWFNYHRPQNWAFLQGDRTEQLFSRDYRDPSIRRLVLELEEYVPLIEAKEQAIAAHLRAVRVERN